MSDGRTALAEAAAPVVTSDKQQVTEETSRSATEVLICRMPSSFSMNRCRKRSKASASGTTILRM